MNYTIQDVIEFIKENDVKFIRLAFCDIFGRIKNFSVMSDRIEEVYKNGASFSPFGIAGFEKVKSDLLLFPDLNTLSVLPWRPQQGRVIKFLCEIRNYDNTPFLLDTRELLKKTLESAGAKGISCKVETESEFYLFKTDENGIPTYETHDNGGYLDMAPLDKGENIRREICYSLEAMGIKPTSSHHEKGRGQHELVFEDADALKACDNFISFKSVVKAVSIRNGLHASFIPKPFENECGNGMRLKFSLFKNGENIFGGNVDSLTLQAKRFISGVMLHIKEMTAFINSTVNSYERLGSHEAPEYISWSKYNEGQLIKVSNAADGVKIELRSPDSALNPYIAVTLILAAGIDAIEKESEITEPVVFSDEIKEKLEVLPGSLSEAVKFAEESGFIRNTLPPELLEGFFRLQKEQEINALKNIGEYNRNLFRTV